jgi:hypothetical protein
MVEEKVKNFSQEADDAQETNVEFIGDAAPWTSLFKPYANFCDYVFLYSGFCMAAVFGAAMPCFVLVFGNMITDMGEGGSDDV